MDHAFEDIEIKSNAAELLDEALAKKRRPCMVSTGAMCDPYLHAEDREKLTRRCLEVILRRGCGVAVQTKSDRIMRDIDLLTEINRRAKCVVEMTLTTADDALCKIVEPNVAVTSRRAEVLCKMQERGIPTIVWLTPILPFLNDTAENAVSIVDMCAACGVYGIIYYGAGVTLRSGDREYFYSQLDRRFSGIKEKYIRAFGDRYVCISPRSAEIDRAFYAAAEQHGIVTGNEELFSYMCRWEGKFQQLGLFDEER